MNTTPYFVWTTKADVSRRAAAEINAAVQHVDPDMYFCRHYAAGNETHGWLERPNDGTNDQHSRRATSSRCVEIAKKVLGL